MATSQPGALAWLERDHRKVVTLFERFERAKSLDEKLTIANEICLELTIHTKVEERVFYPAVRESLDDDELVDEAEAEHHGMKRLIASLDGLSAHDESFQPAMLLLKEHVDEHIQEEELVIFPHLRASHIEFSRLEKDLEDTKERLTHSILPHALDPSSLSVPRFAAGAQLPPKQSESRRRR